MLDIFRMIDLTGYFLFPDVNYRCLRKPSGKSPQSYTIEFIGQGGATDIMVCEDYGCICSASLGFENSEIKADLRILKGDTSPGDGLLSRIGRHILQAPGSVEIEKVKKRDSKQAFHHKDRNLELAGKCGYKNKKGRGNLPPA